jgi:ABC-type sugar transport system substrate-binding protein
MRKTTGTRLALLVTASALALTACGGGSSSSSAASGGAPDSGNKKLVMFLPSTSNVYLAADVKGAKEEAASLGYELKVIENNFDQAEEDQQVQQYLAGGEKPAAVLWWPASSKAGVNSTRLLSRMAPVIQFNQGIVPEQAPFVKAYAGVNDKGIGSTAGEMALKARDEAVAKGMKLHSPGGNLIEFAFTAGYQAGIDRHDSFLEATKAKPFNILQNEPAGFDAQAGYKAASQVIPKFKSQGIDFVYAQNNNMAVGIVKALKQNGLTPGKDVMVIAGDLSGDKQPLKDGDVYSAVIESPVIEGKLVVRTAVQYLQTGKVQPGTEEVKPDATDPGLQSTPPYATAYMPNPPVTKDTLDTIKIWGMDVYTLCV